LGHSTRKVQGLTIAASLAFHAALTGVLAGGAGRGVGVDSAAPQPPTAASDPAERADVAAAAEGALVDVRVEDPVGDLPRVTAGDSVAHLDRGSPGRGGDATARERALNLAEDNDRMRLSPDALSRLDRDQLQRLRVARVRTSWDDRRATPHPAELTLVVIGPGSVRERRPTSAWAPSRGALDSPLPSVEGGQEGALGALALDAGDDGERQGGRRVGSARGEPGIGLLDGRAGTDHRRSAPVGEARPDVVRGAVAVPARDRARPRDSIDSQQEVATTVRSLVLASTAGGRGGSGEGGSGGGGEAGAGAATGAGSLARPLGIGDGDVFDYWTTDPRLVSYFRRIHARVDPLWADAFPKSALFELKQGTVILDVTVLADGSVSVSWPPVRPSGVDEFDRNCADAVRRAAPLPPIPPELGVRSLRIRAPFVASNPVVK
jgi:TonB family protein